ncbi:hypothetical protein TSAR_009025 [Trichomalopsis sarcophagae]|uniref:Cytochrome P450 n=1 Tax=Trichomalopsis sarcophagae TaxID=543379 RepID=A0A232FAH5_9HYME|nr:hypothetical protein TSAR_009025 [Trichomalopsis sarcophagae]
MEMTATPATDMYSFIRRPSSSRDCDVGETNSAVREGSTFFWIGSATTAVVFMQWLMDRRKNKLEGHCEDITSKCSQNYLKFRNIQFELDSLNQHKSIKLPLQTFSLYHQKTLALNQAHVFDKDSEPAHNTPPFKQRNSSHTADVEECDDGGAEEDKGEYICHSIRGKSVYTSIAAEETRDVAGVSTCLCASRLFARSTNLFNLTGERWKEVRNLVSPAFTSSKMKAMFELIVQCAKDFVGYLEERPA